MYAYLHQQKVQCHNCIDHLVVVYIVSMQLSICCHHGSMPYPWIHMDVSGTLVYIFDVYNLCVHTYMHVLYMHVFMHMYVCVFLHIRVCMCVCVCV